MSLTFREICAKKNSPVFMIAIMKTGLGMFFCSNFSETGQNSAVLR